MEIMKIIDKIQNIENIELYFIAFLLLFTLWFVVNTLKFYIAKRRKEKQLYRFSRGRKTISGYELAKRYAKSQSTKK